MFGVFFFEKQFFFSSVWKSSLVCAVERSNNITFCHFHFGTVPDRRLVFIVYWAISTDPNQMFDNIIF